MQSIISVDIFCFIILGILELGLLTKKRVRFDSTKALSSVCIAIMVCCGLDAICYLISGPVIPDFCYLILWILNFIAGSVTELLFTYYCYVYIRENASANKWDFYVPMILIVAEIIGIIITGFAGNLVSVNNGVVQFTGGMPKWAVCILIIVSAYLPCLAYLKRKEIGITPVLLFAFFGFLPFATSIFTLFTNNYDYSYPAFAISFLIIYVLLSNKLNFQKDQKNQRYLEERINIIQSVTSIFFASYYIDLEKGSYVEYSAKDSIKLKIPSKGNAQNFLNVACEQLIIPAYYEIMREFFDLSTITERLKDRNVVTCNYIGVTTGWSMAYLIAGDRDMFGNVRHVFFCARTIHDEKEREQEQNKKMEEYNNIIANAGIGVWHIFLKSGEEPRMQANEKMRELLGIKETNLTEEELYNRWYDRIVPEAVPSVLKSVREMIEGKFSENTYLWAHPTLGGIYVRCGGTAQKLEDGSHLLSGYHYDVTKIVIKEEKYKADLAMARQAAESASNAKTSFLFNMSHDIRTPMNAIIGFTDLLQKNLDNRAKAEDYIRKIQDSNAFLLSLINNVLEMARIESGKAVLEETYWNAQLFNDTVYSVFTESMKKKHLTFTRTVDVQHKDVLCDTTKVREIFLNLLSNAMKYTPDGGTVCMDLKEIPSNMEGYAMYQTVISDTGIGMSKEFLAHIFEDFSRERTSTESKVEGSGLGMAIVKKLIDLMKGTIEIESELGKGTRITVVLPHKIASTREIEHISETEMENYTQSFEGKKILLAEDNDLNAEIAIEILTDAGFIVERAEDGAICVKKLTENQPGFYDLILMDVQMPNMNGYEATMKIRALEDKEKADIPIVAMTANAFEEDKNDARRAGMNGHLAKPINVKKLIKTLSEILKEEA